MTQHERAHLWRTSRKLTVAELSVLTGYSIEAVYAMERGITPLRYATAGKPHKGKAKPVEEWVWLRYKNACRGVEHQLRTGKEWDWT